MGVDITEKDLPKLRKILESLGDKFTLSELQQCLQKHSDPEIERTTPIWAEFSSVEEFFKTL